jgi:ribosomal protein S8
MQELDRLSDRVTVNVIGETYEKRPPLVVLFSSAANMAKLPAIQSLERISRPGLRQYAKPGEFRRVKNGLGVAIVSTSKGVMTDKDAKAQNVGGEVLCYIY